MLALLFAVLFNVEAHADEAEVKAAAEALFDAGKKLRAEGKFLDAAVKFEASQRLDPGVGTLLRLAASYQEAGRLASAWANFRHAESMARGQGDERRADLARDRAGKLEPRLSKLAIALGSNATIAGLEVRRGDVVIDPALSNVHVPVDTGTHTVVVTAPGHEPYETTVTLASEGRVETVTIPPLVGVAAPEPEPVEVPAPAPVPAPDPPQPPTPDAPSYGQQIVALTFGAASVVTLGIGLGFMASAISLDSDAGEHCDGTVCRDEEGASLSQDALTHADVATFGFVAAGVLGATALALLLTSDWPDEERAAALTIVPAAGPHGAAVGVGVRF